MLQKNRINLLPLFILCFLIYSCSKNYSDTPPNIILIMTDDQGIGDLGITGNSVIETPHIDAMAKISASMDRFYVSPVCSPTRASLMTGRYNYRTGVVDTWVGRSMMFSDETTIAEVLKKGGYATGIFGKWHLGDAYPMRPQDQGFDEVLVHKGGGLAQPGDPFENERRYTDAILFKNGERFQSEGYCTDVYFDTALDFMEKNRNEGKPFFAYIPTNAPHGPYHDVPELLRKKYQKKDISSVIRSENPVDSAQVDRVERVFAMVDNIDQNVGKLFKKLETLDILANTLVIFMVDNGPNSRRYVGDLRGMKTEVHEGGIRSPFFAHWPAQIPAGTRSDRIAAHIDVFPTLLSAAGVSVPRDLKIDGRNILPLLKGEKTDWQDRKIFIQTHRGDVPQLHQHFAAIGQQYKLVHPTGFGVAFADIEKTPFELYDLVDDEGENENLFQKEQDIGNTILKEYETWFADMSATRKGDFEPPRIIVGTEYETETVLTAQDRRKTEGGGWGLDGHWLLEVAEGGSFDIEIRLPSPRKGWDAELVLNDERFGQVMGISSSLFFKDIALKPGQLTLEARVQKGDQKDPWLHVHIYKK